MMPQPHGDSIEIGQAALATLGLSNVLKGECSRVGVEKQREIIGIGKRIDDLAMDFVYDRLPRKLSMPRPFTYRQLLERFTRPLSQAETNALQAKFPADAGDEWLAFKSVLDQSFAHLSEMVPVATYDTYLGPKRIKPTSDKTFEFFLKLWVIDDPLIAFQLMQSGALIPEQVSALLEFFPSLYTRMKSSILDALVSRNAKESSFMNLPPRADRGLATFKQQRIVPYGPNIHVAPPQPNSGGMSPTPKVNPALQTAGQRAASISG